jgi:hypothetical protein
MGTTIYQLNISLIGIRPVIWRRFIVPANIHLHRFHLMLQAIMGWTNSHLYRFQINGIEYGELDPDNEFDELDFVDSHRTKLNQVVFQKKASFIYIYDFGDDWQHRITVEKIMSDDSEGAYPLCLAGARSHPPEDCGGIGGYTELLKIIRNPRHKEYEEMMYWLGGSFDPESFDLKRINRALNRFHPKNKPIQIPIPEAFRKAVDDTHYPSN